MPSPARGKRWTNEAREAWASWWASPMAAAWIEADVVALRRALRLVDAAARGDTSASAPLTALEDEQAARAIGASDPAVESGTCTYEVVPMQLVRPG